MELGTPTPLPLDRSGGPSRGLLEAVAQMYVAYEVEAEAASVAHRLSYGDGDLEAPGSGKAVAPQVSRCVCVCVGVWVIEWVGTFFNLEGNQKEPQHFVVPHHLGTSWANELELIWG